eukprot:Em0003g1136a
MMETSSAAGLPKNQLDSLHQDISDLVVAGDHISTIFAGYTESPLKYRGQATTLQQSGKQVDLDGVQDPQRELQTARLRHGVKKWTFDGLCLPMKIYSRGGTDLDRIAVALALTRFVLILPYSSWVTTDLDFLNDVAKRDSSLEKKSLAVKPHAPWDSATNGTHTQPKSAHFPVLALSFLSSVALAAAPASHSRFQKGLGHIVAKPVMAIDNIPTTLACCGMMAKRIETHFQDTAHIGHHQKCLNLATT